MYKVTELHLTLKKIDAATYFKRVYGITFQAFLAFQVKEKIPTDRLIVSDEAVRVLDVKE